LSQRAGRRVLVAVVAAGLVATLLGLDPSATIDAAPTPFAVRGSVNQVSVVDLAAGAPVELLDSSLGVVATAEPDTQNAHLFRDVPVGTYRVRQSGEVSDPVDVTAFDDHPDGSFYDGITISQGYGYVPTRDGTTLNINVTFPLDGSPGPWPVLVDYSGYDPGAPGDPPREAFVFALHGYVVVGVNMRGTGCSGGAFDYFEPLQSTDGYDVVEAVARQPWSNGDVGLVGISYPGISQLFVARTQPPHLRAITPLSVIADTYRSTLYPGGILNSGFALGWATDRVEGAKPLARQWARNRIEGGDTTCEQNQKLRLQARDLLAEIRPDRFYEAAGDALSPRTFVDDIEVPVYLAGQFQDEQTGGHFSTMVPNFAPTTKVRATLTNGTHVEPLGPEQIVRLVEFVDFYVGKRIPAFDPLVRAGIPIIYNDLFGFPDATLPPDRFTGFSDYAAALAAYEAEPPIRILWENGAGRDPGEPYSTAESFHSAWPIPGAETRSWYLAPDGRLTDTAPTIGDGEPRGSSSYVFDPATKRASTFDGSTEAIWKVAPDVHWEPLVEGHSLNFVTAPFTDETAMAGWGSVDLWLRSEAADTDLEVTLTEVRGDGQERFIQSGWLRASHRKLDTAESTPLQPFHTHLEPDAEPLPAGAFVPARVALFPFTHVIRPGSRLRLNIEAPGGNQPFWKYDTITPHGVRNDIAHSVGRPSKLALPVLPPGEAPAVPASAPPCPSLRNQPCRPYLPARVATDVHLVQEGASDLDVVWTPPERDGEPMHYIVDLERIGAADSAPQIAEVAGNETSHVFGTEPGFAYVATVQAVYDDGPAPVSNASMALTVSTQPEAPATTAPQSDAAPPDAAEIDTASGSLPTTGSNVVPVVLVALVLLGVGVVLVMLTRRAPARSGGAPTGPPDWRGR
jgi:predicted acyl esterase